MKYILDCLNKAFGFVAKVAAVLILFGVLIGLLFGLIFALI